MEMVSAGGTLKEDVMDRVPYHNLAEVRVGCSGSKEPKVDEAAFNLGVGANLEVDDL